MRFRLLILSDKKKSTKEDIEVLEFIAKNKKKLNGCNIFIEARTINLLEYNDPVMKKEFKAKDIKSLPVLFNKKIKIYKDEIKEKLVMLMLDAKQSILNRRPQTERIPNPYLDKHAAADDDDEDTGIDGEKMSNKDITNRMNAFYSRRTSAPPPSNNVNDDDDDEPKAKTKAKTKTKTSTSAKKSGSTDATGAAKPSKYLDDLSDDSDDDGDSGGSGSGGNGNFGNRINQDNVARPSSLNLSSLNEKIKSFGDDPTSGISDEDLLIRFGMSDD